MLAELETHAAEFLRCESLMRNARAVFVFGSNLHGVHGNGAAKTAKDLYGARSGQGVGLFGRSYAIPTKNSPYGRRLPLHDIGLYVAAFTAMAETLYQDRLFVVTRVGCGNAGYADAEIAPLFEKAPKNCLLPPHWTQRP